MDWKDSTRSGFFECWMVNPANLDATNGRLEGVDFSKSSLTASYYSDTRTSGKIALVDGNWDRRSFIRVVFRVPEQGYARTVGTYIVTDDAAKWEKGAWHQTLTLQSVLYGLSTDLGTDPWTVKANSYALTAMKQMLDRCGRRHSMTNALDKQIKNTMVMETGGSYLSRLFSLCDVSGNRLDVDGMGYVTVGRYERPMSRAAELRIDLDDPRGVAFDGIERSSDFLKTPARSIVSYKYSETVGGKSVEREVRATYEAPKSEPAWQRGYMVAEFHSVNEMSPATWERARQVAKKYMDAADHDDVRWTLKTTYLPVWEGSVIEMAVPSGDYAGVRHCLVQSVDMDLLYGDMKLKLKETYMDSGDGL